jgi:hypothetical protein
MSKGTKAILLSKLSVSNGLAQIFFYFRHSRRIRELPQGQRWGRSNSVIACHCKPPRKFLAPVGVVSTLKKTNESLATSSADSTLHNAPVIVPVFAIGCLPILIKVIYAHSFSPFSFFAVILHFVLEFRSVFVLKIPKLFREIPIFQPPAQPILILSG